MFAEMTKFFLLVLISNLLLIFNIKKISKLINIFDKPDNILKKHKYNVPLLGGFFIACNLVLYFLLEIIFNLQFINIDASIREYISIFFFLFSFFILGIIDDKFKLNPEKKFFISIFFSILVLSLNKDLLITNLKFSFYENRLFLNEFSFFFTIFCIIILLNALNFYDGINGQSVIFFILIFIHLAILSQIYIFYVFIILVLIFILILNLQNKIFMGDNGIYILGSMLIVALIYEYNEFKSIQFADEIFLLLILPGYDLVRLSLSRIFKGKNPFYGDRNHIHHLINSKLSISYTNIILLLLASLPITFFSYFEINFFIVLLIFSILYTAIIIFFKK
tara:strand:- start:3515 stop:4522 length:1008 start_codon:yes stop_codon:yes gene_type:complete